MAAMHCSTTKCAIILLVFTGVSIANTLKSSDDTKLDQDTESFKNDDTSIDNIIKSFGIVTKHNLLPDIDVVKGDMNLVLAAPHGGYKMPKYIPNRVAGCYQNGACVYNHTCYPKSILRCLANTVHDDMTRELTFLIAYEIQRLVGKTPHLVINNLARLKLDPNRERHQATFDEPDAISAYDKYHNSIEKAKATFDEPGLFLDIHGNGHKIQRTELGYQITGDDLDRGTLSPSNSSIRTLASRVNISFEDLVRGPQSLGGLLVKRGYRAVPSPDELGPEGNPYFDGQYDTFAHGSVKGGDVDGIMAESAKAYRTNEVIKTYAKDFAGAVVEFMQLYYNLQIPWYSPIINAAAMNIDSPHAQALMANQNDSLMSTVQGLEVKSTKEYDRLPVLLSAGIFVTVLSVGLIVGGLYWKKNQKKMPTGYVSLNGGQYPFSVDSD